MLLEIRAWKEEAINVYLSIMFDLYEYRIYVKLV